MELERKKPHVQSIIPNIRNQFQGIKESREQNTKDNPYHDHHRIRGRIVPKRLFQYDLLDSPVPSDSSYKQDKYPYPPLAESLDFSKDRITCVQFIPFPRPVFSNEPGHNDAGMGHFHIMSIDLLELMLLDKRA